LKYDDDGRIHIGETIRQYLDAHSMKHASFARLLDMTRGGFARILRERSINTERLQQISEISGHNFFQYFHASDDSLNNQMHEPQMLYESKPRRSRVVLDLENGEVVGQHREDSDLLNRVMDMQQRQWDVLEKFIPNLAEMMASNPDFKLDDVKSPVPPVRKPSEKKPRNDGDVV